MATPSTGGPERPALQTEPTRSSRPRRWTILVAALLAACGGYAIYAFAAKTEGGKSEAGSPAAAKAGPPAVPVVAVAARQGDVPVYLSGLGTVAAYNTVTVKSRVDGQLLRIAIQEGQFVHEGDLVAEIDPRPFEVQLTQAEGQMARDQAQLRDAKLNLGRNQALLGRELIARQQVDDQAAAVGQYEGAVKMDQGLIDNAKLQLTYAKITAPISGRAGLRLVDAGNIVHANDANGLFVITQVQPISVFFTLPEDDLQALLKRMHAGEKLTVEAYDRAGQKQIATGELLTIDNQIDPATGTMRVKSVFPNADGALYPNQFVNVRLLLDVDRGVLIAPRAAIQRGPQGSFAYVVKPDQTVEVRPIQVGPIAGDDAAIEAGLSPGELVVVDGTDKLRAGSSVRVQAARGEEAAPPPKS